MQVRQVSTAEEPTESAAKKRQCERSHRSKERSECTIRATTTEGWPEVEYKTLRPQSEEQLGNASAGLESAVEHHRPDANNRERCKGERQYGGDTDRRSDARAVLTREPGLREAAMRAALDADYRSGERELHCVISSD